MGAIRLGLVFFGLTLLNGCGGGESELSAITPSANTPLSNTPLSNPSLSNTAGCEALTADLIQQVGSAYQLVKNLALAGGKNVASMEKGMGLPDPATFRSFADLFEQLDVSNVEALPNFDNPQITSPAIREMADKLEAALAQKENLDHPAWAELADFSKRRQNRQQLSINYYLNQLNCN